jgi:hypothetical protein
MNTPIVDYTMVLLTWELKICSSAILVTSVISIKHELYILQVVINLVSLVAKYCMNNM